MRRLYVAGTAFAKVEAAGASGGGGGGGENHAAAAGPNAPANPCGGGRPGDLAELVGIARVPKVSGQWDWLMNTLLLLPTDALAVLPCRLRVWDGNAAGGVVDDDDDADTEEEAAIVAALDARFEKEVSARRR